MTEEGREPPVPPPDRSALLLDVDRALVDLGALPEVAAISPEGVHLLARLHDRLAGALALVSPRPAAEVDDLVAPLRLTAIVAGAADSGADDAVETVLARPPFAGRRPVLVGGDGSVARAVTAAGGRVVAVGGDDPVEALAGPRDVHRWLETWLSR